MTETEFFKRIGSGTEMNHADMQVHYNQFAEAAITLTASTLHPSKGFAALAFAEVELEHYVMEGTDLARHYAKKAMSFIRRLMRHHHFSSSHHNWHGIKKTVTASSEKAPPMRWTGNVVELIEMIYGLDELRCVNNGEIGVNVLFAQIGKMFGLELKDSQCYNAYTDMKRRKSSSRTYFLDNMAEGLNRRMKADDEKERYRR